MQASKLSKIHREIHRHTDGQTDLQTDIQTGTKLRQQSVSHSTDRTDRTDWLPENRGSAGVRKDTQEDPRWSSDTQEDPRWSHGAQLSALQTGSGGSWDRVECSSDRIGPVLAALGTVLRVLQTGSGLSRRFWVSRDTPRRVTLQLQVRVLFWLQLVPEPVTPRPSYSLYWCLAAATDTQAFDAGAALSSEHRCPARRPAQIAPGVGQDAWRP